MARMSSPAFWEDLYARGDDGWEMGRPAPPLGDFVESTPPPRGRVLVPGAFAPLRSARGRPGREWMVLARNTGGAR